MAAWPDQSSKLMRTEPIGTPRPFGFGQARQARRKASTRVRTARVEGQRQNFFKPVAVLGRLRAVPSCNPPLKLAMRVARHVRPNRLAPMWWRRGARGSALLRAVPLAGWGRDQQGTRLPIIQITARGHAMDGREGGLGAGRGQRAGGAAQAGRVRQPSGHHRGAGGRPWPGSRAGRAWQGRTRDGKFTGSRLAAAAVRREGYCEGKPGREWVRIIRRVLVNSRHRNGAID